RFNAPQSTLIPITNSYLLLPTPVVMSAASTTRSMAKKPLQNERRPLLEIQIPAREADTPIAVQNPAPEPKSAAQTIEALIKADPQRFLPKKIDLPPHDEKFAPSVEAANFRAKHAMMHHTVCPDQTCPIHRSSHMHSKRFYQNNHCMYCDQKGHYADACPINTRDKHKARDVARKWRTVPGIPKWVTEVESLDSDNSNSIAPLAAPSDRP